MKYRVKLLSLIILITSALTFTAPNNAITPHKYKIFAQKRPYKIPPSARFTTKRLEPNAPDIIYYASIPQTKSYPIAIACTGSSRKDSLESIIYFHRDLLQYFMDLQVGLITVEQWGMNGNIIDKKEFIDHYTWSQRFADHRAVIDSLILHPPKGWNGKFIFLGISEGGPLVTRLSTDYSANTLATINWCGAIGEFREAVWAFIKGMRTNGPWWFKLLDRLSQRFPHIITTNMPKNREEFDKYINDARDNPTTTKEFGGMTYKYIADGLHYPPPHYKKIMQPFLLVAGAKDSMIPSCDDFATKAKKAGVNITYLRVKNMDHYICRRPDIINKTFKWLRHQIDSYTKQHSTSNSGHPRTHSKVVSRRYKACKLS